ncbi:hypothetical protein DIURU_004999 [Diutina rugosa]|uniref:Opaque-phase-specific protein OP4 n=1 Tax=Diutina rugosa TaxID=5481 RepID=A0A642UFV2_DIURU|nr:uncharacterized protein DIURU_004999 [Diutina rugosa]KAA8898144.1 hypothetical protein DIURU_004999 [Diutina rugosa]
MKYSHSALAALAVATQASAYVPVVDTDAHLVLKRETQDLHKDLAELESMRARRDVMLADIQAREYQIVTDVLAAIKNTNLAPEIIHYFATSPTFAPITISAIVYLLKSGLINYKALLEALDQSHLVTKVVNDLISDCSLYVDLFNIAKGYINDLLPVVKEKIQEGISNLFVREQADELPLPSLEVRDVSPIVVNLMDSLGQSGLATQVVRDILTDTSYYPFAVSLVSAVLAAGGINVDEIVSAVKESGFVSNLMDELLTVNTFKTVVTNAFAAFAGDCANAGNISFGGGSSSSGSSNSGSSGTSTGSTGGGTVIKNPCKKRKRSFNYNY